MMKRLWITLLLFTLAIEATITTTEIGVVINLAGKQRMLTQKMSKEALLVGKEIDQDKNREALKKSIQLFDKTLKGLINGDRSLRIPKTEDKAIKKELQSITDLWRVFKPFVDKIATGTFNRTALKAVEMGNIPLLKKMHHIVEMYEKKYQTKKNSKRVTTINLAGKERMLIQKMIKDLLLIAHNLESNSYMKSLKNDGLFFKNNLFKLINDKEAMKNPKIIKELQEIQQLWNEYQQTIIHTELSKEGIREFNKKEKVFIKEMTSKLIIVATQVDKQRYQNDLKKSANEFEKILKGLINGNPQLGILKTKNKNIQKELRQIKTDWVEYKEIMLSLDTSKTALEKAMKINMPLVNKMDRVVKLYELEDQ